MEINLSMFNPFYKRRKREKEMKQSIASINDTIKDLMRQSNVMVSVSNKTKESFNQIMQTQSTLIDSIDLLTKGQSEIIKSLSLKDTDDAPKLIADCKFCGEEFIKTHRLREYCPSKYNKKDYCKNEYKRIKNQEC